jgi:hypothetical protein
VLWTAARHGSVSVDNIASDHWHVFDKLVRAGLLEKRAGSPGRTSDESGTAPTYHLTRTGRVAAGVEIPVSQ